MECKNLAGNQQKQCTSLYFRQTSRDRGRGCVKICLPLRRALGQISLVLCCCRKFEALREEMCNVQSVQRGLEKEIWTPLSEHFTSSMSSRNFCCSLIQILSEKAVCAMNIHHRLENLANIQPRACECDCKTKKLPRAFLSYADESSPSGFCRAKWE